MATPNMPANPAAAIQPTSAPGIPGPNPASGDILDIVASDHRKVEDLFRALRNRENDRATLQFEMANNLLAHNDAEELHFYPHVRDLSDKKVDGDTEITHEISEHVEGLIALHNLLEEPDVRSKSWEDKLSALIAGVVHHVDDEEQNTHNLARSGITPQKRVEMGALFMKARDGMLGQNVGSLENVRLLVKERASLLQKAKVSLVG